MTVETFKMVAINKVLKWSMDWEMEFNPKVKKCEFLRVTKRNKLFNPHSY